MVMTRLLLLLVLALGLTFGSVSDLLAKSGSQEASRGSKGSHYSGGKGSGLKGGQYTPPYKKRYKKKQEGPTRH
jgi:hypothetical protein